MQLELVKRVSRFVRVSILTRPEGRVQLATSAHLARLLEAVSILTRPEGRVQPDGAPYASSALAVSILTRPEGRVQQMETKKIAVTGLGFNPHPSRRTGATAPKL